MTSSRASSLIQPTGRPFHGSMNFVRLSGKAQTAIARMSICATTIHFGRICAGYLGPRAGQPIPPPLGPTRLSHRCKIDINLTALPFSCFIFGSTAMFLLLIGPFDWNAVLRNCLPASRPCISRPALQGPFGRETARASPEGLDIPVVTCRSGATSLRSRVANMSPFYDRIEPSARVRNESDGTSFAYREMLLA